MKRNLLLLLLFVGCVTMKAQDYRLWYDKPAMTWTQALPVGNGVVGGSTTAKVYVDNIVFTYYKEEGGVVGDINGRPGIRR